MRVTCCGRDTGLSLRYVNETAVTFIWVEARKLQPLDLSSITSEYGVYGRKERIVWHFFLVPLSDQFSYFQVFFLETDNLHNLARSH